MKKNIKIVSIFLCGLMLSSILVGCSSNKDVKDSKVPTYKIGVLAPITGTNAEYGKGFQVATQMAADEINSKGKMKIILDVKDSKADTKESADLARQFGDDENTLAIVGDFTSSCCMANAPIVDEAGIVQLSPTASSPQYGAMSKYCFSIMGRQDGEAPFFSTYLLKKYLKAKNVAVIWINSDWGKSAFENFVKQAKKDGLNIVANANYTADEVDYSSAISKLRAAKPDYVIIMDQGAVSAIINQIRAANWKNVTITALGPGTSPQILSLAGKNAEGLLLSTPFMITANDKRASSWAKEFTAKAGFEPTVHPACAYDCIYLLAGAIEKCGDKVTRDKIRENLQNTQNFVGITGPIKFNKDGDITRKYLIAGIKDGKYVKETDYDFAQ
jgi:branched-chain amino acid transport system substrate-binding protein